jgi:hypothetical protein
MLLSPQASVMRMLLARRDVFFFSTTRSTPPAALILLLDVCFPELNAQIFATAFQQQKGVLK